MRNNLCLPKVLFGKKIVRTRGWHFTISIQILRLAKLWKGVENSCKQPGKEVLRDCLTDISTTNLKQPLYLSFSLPPELFGAGSLKEAMLAGRFSTSHRSFKQFCHLYKWSEIAASTLWSNGSGKSLCLDLHHFIRIFSLFLMLEEKETILADEGDVFYILLPCQMWYQLYAPPEKDPHSKANSASRRVQRQMSDSAPMHGHVQPRDTKAECITEYSLPTTSRFLAYTL